MTSTPSSGSCSSKRYATVACFLAEANKLVLDQLVEMHHVFLTGLYRRAQHAFEKRHKELRARSTRNLRVVLDTLDALLEPECAIADVARELDLSAVRDAIAGCRELQRVNDCGHLKELLRRHHWLKRYLPAFLRLPFEGTPGTEPPLAAIVLARQIHADQRAVLGADAPVEFATGMWRRALADGERGAPDPAHGSSLWPPRCATRSARATCTSPRAGITSRSGTSCRARSSGLRSARRLYVDLNLPTDADRAIERLRAELDTAAAAFAGGLEANPFASLDDAKRDELLAGARRREFDAILVWKLDRWGRSVANLVATLNKLTALGVVFVSMTEALDLLTPSGRALAGMLAVFAEFERDLLRERVRGGLERARREGKHLGRPPTAATHAPEVRALRRRALSHAGSASARRPSVGSSRTRGRRSGDGQSSVASGSRAKMAKITRAWSLGQHGREPKATPSRPVRDAAKKSPRSGAQREAGPGTGAAEGRLDLDPGAQVIDAGGDVAATETRSA